MNYVSKDVVLFLKSTFNRSIKVSSYYILYFRKEKIPSTINYHLDKSNRDSSV